jgi:hypothetical protein
VAGGTSWHWPTVGQGTQQLRMAFDYYLLLPSKCRITQPRAHWDMQGHRTNIMSMDFIICASLPASRAALYANGGVSLPIIIIIGSHQITHGALCAVQLSPAPTILPVQHPS